MSEFQERHTVSTLKGAPPGYVGYGEGGRLTEAVRRRPYSVVLLDEIEKAHQDVHEVFFQVFDKGAMEDGEGRLIDFKNTLILMTSNVGDETLTALAERGGADLETAQQALRDPLLAVFPPAFLGRLVVLPYYPLSDAVLLRVIESRLARIGERVAERYGASFHYDPAVCDLLRRRCVERESGGRAIDAILSNSLLPRLAETFLVRAQNDEPIKRVEISVEADDLSYAFA